MPTMINCPYCGKLTDPNLDNCVHCGGFLERPGPASPATPEAPSQTCPRCGALVREHDVICVACKTNLLTGDRVGEEAPLEEAESSRTPMLIGIAVVVLVVVVLVGVALMLLRDPVRTARQLIDEDRISEAREILENRIAKDPRNSEAHLQMGRVHWATADFQGAADSFGQAFELDPTNWDAGMSALLSYTRDDLERTRDRQVSILERLVDRRPDEPGLQRALALARGASGDVAGQIQDLDRLNDYEPLDANLRQALAIAHALDDNTRDAVDELERALRDDPDNADLTAALGIVQDVGGDLEASTESLTRAARNNTSLKREALTQLALRLIERGEFAQAASYLDEVVQLSNPGAEARYFYGVCLQNQGRSPEALREFEAIVTKNDKLVGDAGLRAAQLYVEMDSRDRAVEALTKASRDATISQAALETVRGRIHMAEGNDAAARESFRKAVSADPLYAPAHLENGLWYVRKQVIAEGVRELEQYLALVDPNDPTSRALEVQALVSQLEQSMSGGAAPPAVQARDTGREPQ